MPEGTTERSSGDRYWYGGADSSATAVLAAVRRQRAADISMRRRTRDDMDMGETDLAALRWIIREEIEHRSVTSAGLARALGISTAAVVKVVSRLESGGYVDRMPHPSDRRVLLLGTLPGAHERLRRTLGPMHERMLRLAESLEPAERGVVIAFLDGLSAIMDAEIGVPDASPAGRTAAERAAPA